MPYKHIKTCSTSLVIRKVKINMPIRYYLKTKRETIYKMLDNYIEQQISILSLLCM